MVVSKEQVYLIIEKGSIFIIILKILSNNIALKINNNIRLRQK